MASGGAHAFSSRPEDRTAPRVSFPLVEASGPFLDLATTGAIAAFGRLFHGELPLTFVAGEPTS